MRTPSALSRRRIESAAVEILDQHALGDLELQPRRRKAGFQQHRVDQPGKIAVAELDRRQIDGDLQRLRPARRLAAGLAEHPFADLHDEPAFLGDRNEGCGRNHAALRMVPAHQRLEPDHLAVDLRQRLIVQTKFVALDGRAQFVLNGAPLAQPVVHFDFEEARRAAAGGLGAVERGIGIVEQRRCVGAVGRKDRDADAETDAQMLRRSDPISVATAACKPLGERLGELPVDRRSA